MAITKLPPYQVQVKDYHWTDKKVRVQSPVLKLEKTGLSPVFRPKEGKNRDEPRIASQTEELIDDVGEPEYFTDAHGLFVLDEPWAPPIPLWVTYEQVPCESEGIIPFVDLATNTCRRGSISRICWVPTHKSRDGKLYTILGGVRIVRRERMKTSQTDACVQYEDAPEGARFTSLPPDEISCLDVVCSEEKQRKFVKHLELIKRNCGAVPPGMAAMLTAKPRPHFSNGRPAPKRKSDSHCSRRPAEHILFDIPNVILSPAKSSLCSEKPELFAIPACRVEPAERILYSANRRYSRGHCDTPDGSYDEGDSGQKSLSPVPTQAQSGVSHQSHLLLHGYRVAA